MVVEVLSILSQQGNQIVARIQQNLAATGTNATGKTSRSIHFEVKDEGFKQTLRVLGKPYLFVVETGRKPTPQFTKPSREFVASIKEWADTKGLGQFAYGIAKSIHAKGTKLYRDGGRKDIISNVVNDELTAQISKDILAKFADTYLKNLVTIANNTNQAGRS
jgi:hypothetical protein